MRVLRLVCDTAALRFITAIGPRSNRQGSAESERCGDMSGLPAEIIAIVDDEEIVLRAMERLLRSAGLTARTFASGADFLKAVPDLDPACVVLDLHMPDVSGFAVLESLRRTRPVVVITGHDSPEAHQRAIAGGAVAYLRKPVGERVLLDAIQAAISSAPALARGQQ